MPVLMHVCTESRQLALKKYTVRLGGTTIPNDCARIDPKEDTIFLPYGAQHLFWRGELSKEAISTIQFLAVDHQIGIGGVWDAYDFFEFSALKDVYIVIDNTGLEYHCEECGRENLLGNAVSMSLTELSPDEYDHYDIDVGGVYGLLEEVKEIHQQPDWKVPKVTVVNINRTEIMVHRKYWGY